MIKRLIAIAAAVLMLIGSTQIPQASNGEPVRQEEQHDRTASVSSKNSSSNSGPEEAPESADESARRIIDTDRLPDRRVAEHTEESKGVEVDEYKGVLSTVSTDIWAGSGEDSTGEDVDFGTAESYQPEPDGAEQPAESENGQLADLEPSGDDTGDAADSWEAEVVPEEPVAEEPAPEETQMEYLGDWTISFYCNCSQCCGSWSGGPTASGAMPTPWYTVATGDLPFGTMLYIDGLGTFEVQDRGTGYGWADVFVSDHGEALANGLQYRSVWRVIS